MEKLPYFHQPVERTRWYHYILSLSSACFSISQEKAIFEFGKQVVNVFPNNWLAGIGKGRLPFLVVFHE